jgi:hypothetical protein
VNWVELIGKFILFVLLGMGVLGLDMRFCWCFLIIFLVRGGGAVGGLASPNHRAIRRAQDGAPGFSKATAKDNSKARVAGLDVELHVGP